MGEVYFSWFKKDIAPNLGLDFLQIFRSRSHASERRKTAYRADAQARLVVLGVNEVRFCNQISEIPQPNFGDSATKIRYDSATKLRAIQQPKSASLCNQDPCCTLHGIVSKRGGLEWGGGDNTVTTFKYVAAGPELAGWEVV